MCSWGAVLLFKQQSIGGLGRLDAVPAPCPEQSVQLLCLGSTASPCYKHCLGFLAREAEVCPAWLWTSWTNVKVIISSCLKPLPNAQQYFLPFPREWWVRRLSVSVLQEKLCMMEMIHLWNSTWLSCLMLCALCQYQLKGIRKLWLKDLSRNSFCLHLMSYRS